MKHPNYSSRKISKEDLKAMAHEHISYEIQMFIFSAERMRKGGLNLLENNAMLETFLLHARCLLDFLYPKNARKDDVIADNFFKNPTIFRKKLPTELPIANYLKKRTSKEVAHLTYNRLYITPSEKVWNFANIHDQIGRALVVFFENLTDEMRNSFSTIVTK